MYEYSSVRFYLYVWKIVPIILHNQLCTTTGTVNLMSYSHKNVELPFALKGKKKISKYNKEFKCEKLSRNEVRSTPPTLLFLLRRPQIFLPIPKL